MMPFFKNKRVAPPENDSIVLLGSSTGGPEALRQILTLLPREIPPIVIVQHLPEGISKTLANRFNQLCAFEVKEAQDGDEVQAGRALIAPGGLQTSLKKTASGLRVQVDEASSSNRNNPSVDVLFESVAKLEGHPILAILLTGMGIDGGQGLLKLRQAGARTLAQDEKTSAVYGMPKEAARLSAAEQILPLSEIARVMIEFCNQHTRKGSAQSKNKAS